MDVILQAAPSSPPAASPTWSSCGSCRSWSWPTAPAAAGSSSPTSGTTSPPPSSSSEPIRGGDCGHVTSCRVVIGQLVTYLAATLVVEWAILLAMDATEVFSSVQSCRGSLLPSPNMCQIKWYSKPKTEYHKLMWKPQKWFNDSEGWRWLCLDLT